MEAPSNPSVAGSNPAGRAQVKPKFIDERCNSGSVRGQPGDSFMCETSFTRCVCTSANENLVMTPFSGFAGMVLLDRLAPFAFFDKKGLGPKIGKARSSGIVSPYHRHRRRQAIPGWLPRPSGADRLGRAARRLRTSPH